MLFLALITKIMVDVHRPEKDCRWSLVWSGGLVPTFCIIFASFLHKPNSSLSHFDSERMMIPRKRMRVLRIFFFLRFHVLLSARLLQVQERENKLS